MTDFAEVCSWGSPIDNISSLAQLRQWASYQISKIAGCACAGNTGNVFPRRRLQRKPLVSHPDMHHGTCVTHAPWCMSGSLTRDGGENVPGIPGACANPNFTYLGRGPWLGSKVALPERRWSSSLMNICVTWRPIYWYGLIIIPTWISNHRYCKVWGEIAYPFPHFKGANIENWKWVSNFIPLFMMNVIIYPCGD